MAKDDLKALVRKWFEEVWNNQSEAAVDEMFAPDAKGFGLGQEPVNGPGDFKKFQAQLLEAMPDLHVVVKDVIQEGDKAAVRYSVTATHLGDSLGFPATGKRIEVDGLSLTRWRNGQIVEGWNCYDQLKLMVQIGAVTLPE